MLVKRALDIAIGLALFAGSGCGDDPCGGCPAGSRCEQTKTPDLRNDRYECLVVVKVIDRPRWLVVSEEPQQ